MYKKLTEKLTTNNNNWKVQNTTNTAVASDDDKRTKGECQIEKVKNQEAGSCYIKYCIF